MERSVWTPARLMSFCPVLDPSGAWTHAGTGRAQTSRPTTNTTAASGTQRACMRWTGSACSTSRCGTWSSSTAPMHPTSRTGWADRRFLRFPNVILQQTRAAECPRPQP
uniref:(northern house mosquito) hypothetical protein n=1 Tax=Culex pipiens TaxID=7175 RepID=A0A8D8CD55_CULPI